MGFARDRAGGTASTSSRNGKRQVGGNVSRLLAWREVSPTVRRPLRQVWGEAAAWTVDCLGPRREVTDAGLGLMSWLEADSLKHSVGKYCPLFPPPRSTIAAAFSPDGNTLASTHGDHTVKIVCCRSGQSLKVLTGHRRTPWVVRFHPTSSNVLASGSLDNEVRLWDANTAECFSSRDFYRPIASLAFHAQGDLLAVASGHKLYIWQYTKEREGVHPHIVLRTRRSLRAVHFHPHAAPLLLTAEVTDHDSPDCPMTLATSGGYLHYPPPAIRFISSGLAPGVQHLNAAVASTQQYVTFPSWLWPGLPNGIPSESVAQAEPSTSAGASTSLQGAELFDAVNDTIRGASSQLQPNDYSTEVPMDISPRTSYAGFSLPATTNEVEANGVDRNMLTPGLTNLEELGEDILSRAQEVLSRAREGQDLAVDPGRTSPTVVGAPWDVSESVILPTSVRETDEFGSGTNVGSSIPVIPIARRQVEAGSGEPGMWPLHFANLTGAGSLPQLQQYLPVGDYAGWELPFLQDWVNGQAQEGLGQAAALGGTQAGLSVPAEQRVSPPQQQQLATVAMAAAMTAARAAARNMVAAAGAGLATTSLATGAASTAVRINVSQGMSGQGNVPTLGMAEAAAAQAAAVAAAAAAELPCTVKLRIWPHDIKRPTALLDPETCRLTIPHAVLCSEMGAHFSPCGRFLAACVACVLPLVESELQASRTNMVGSPGPASAVQSPTQHPISSQQVIYELRVYSLEEATFGQVLASRAVRAAHNLTSIQFSPTSDHILLAYGRRHNSLLRSLVVDGNSSLPIPIYTILEIYRVSDMELVRVLPSAEDEVNVACFHPQVGGGLVYGTKEGKLRILRHDRTPRYRSDGTCLEDELLDADTVDHMSFGLVPDIASSSQG